MKIFSFVVLPVIIAPDNVLTPHISETHNLLFHSMNINSNWIDAQKSSQGKREALPSYVEGGSPAPPTRMNLNEPKLA